MLLLFPSRCKFFSLTETPEDYTIIVDEEGFKGGSSGSSPPLRCRRGNGSDGVTAAPLRRPCLSTLSLWFVVGRLSESMSLHTLLRGDLSWLPWRRQGPVLHNLAQVFSPPTCVKQLVGMVKSPNRRPRRRWIRLKPG